MSIETISLGSSKGFSRLSILYAFFAGLFLALGIAIFGGATAAWACDSPGPFCEETPGSGGGGGDNGGGGGNNDDPGPKPPKNTTGKDRPAAGDTFQIDCSNWNGNGSYSPSANCNTTEAAVQNGPHGDPRTGWGYRYQGGGVNLGTLFSANPGCGPQGSKSAYAQTWIKYATEATTTEVDYRLGFVSEYRRGWIPFTVTKVTGVSVYYKFSGCSYPVDTYQYTTCFWNFGGTSQYSLSRTQPNSGWAKFADRPRLGSDPSAPSGGSGGNAPSGRCADGRGTAITVAFGVAPDKLGYYSVTVNYNYRIYTRHAYAKPSGQELYSLGWTPGGTQFQQSTGYWAYSCRPDGSATEGRFPNQGAIPNRDNYLNPATCPQVTWQCVVGNPTTIGLDRAAVLSGSLSPNTKTYAMRNGQPVPIDFSRIRVVDTSTPSDIDVTDGGTAPSVRNITNIAYKTNVKTGSSPFYGDDVNASTQYFKQYTTKEAKTRETFDSWRNNVNANLDKAISFNWASESEASGFALQRQYRVTGEFFIPQGANIGSGSSAGGNVGYQWKVGTYDCRDYLGRGSSRVDRGPLTTTSNDVSVVRSVNK